MSAWADARFGGDGPGPQTHDGCSVELYRLLPYAGEIEFMGTEIPAGSSILELGCGTGRLTRKLLSWGYAVTAVDDSGDMLRHLPDGAIPVHSRIESLSLAKRFDAVLLASCLINHPDPPVRASFLSTAARHLDPGGVFLLERHDPAWLMTVDESYTGRIGDVALNMVRVARTGKRVQMELAYESGSDTWKQRFVAEALDEDSIEGALEEAGFDRPEWLDSKRRWVKAVRS